MADEEKKEPDTKPSTSQTLAERLALRQETIRRLTEPSLTGFLRSARDNQSLFDSIYGSQASVAGFLSARKPLDYFSTSLRPEQTDLEEKINTLKREINKKEQELLNAQVAAEDKEVKLKELAEKHDELREKQSLTHILNRVGEPGASKILRDPDFRAKFQNDAPCKAYVLAIDIRRSTELMLKAREPKLFAGFITTLAISLRQIVLDNFGIFDKFTGDGILAVFPEFFSGTDAGYRTINTAMQCHQAFNDIYNKHRNCFVAVLKDAGLGIGIDYGDVQIIEIGGEFTVVGTPVVYACRMSGAPAYQTLVNQPAYEQLFNKYSEFDFKEDEIEVKHEGSTIAYKVTRNGKTKDPSPPSWLNDTVNQATS